MDRLLSPGCNPKPHPPPVGGGIFGAISDVIGAVAPSVAGVPSPAAAAAGGIRRRTVSGKIAIGAGQQIPGGPPVSGGSGNVTFFGKTSLGAGAGGSGDVTRLGTDKLDEVFAEAQAAALQREDDLVRFFEGFLMVYT